MTDQQSFGSKVAGQRKAGDFEVANFFEHIPRGCSQAGLVLRDVVHESRVLVVRNAVEYTHRLHRFAGLRAGKIDRRRMTGGKALLDEINKKPTVILTPNPILDRSTGLRIEQRRVLDPERFSNRTMVADGEAELRAQVAQ